MVIRNKINQKLPVCPFPRVFSSLYGPTYKLLTINDDWDGDDVCMLILVVLLFKVNSYIHRGKGNKKKQKRKQF